MSTYPVFEVEFEYHGAIHRSAFVKTKKDGTGIMYHVRGAIELDGMTFDCREVDPTKLSTYRSMIKKGDLNKGDIERFADVCKSIEPPAKQFDANGPLSHPLRRCRDWMREVWDRLREERILQA